MRNFIKQRFSRPGSANKLTTPRYSEMRSVFSDIHRRRGWGDGESASGPGSSVERTLAFRDEVAALLKELNVMSILDAGCGDFNWVQELELESISYIGADVVPEIIDLNQRRYGSDNRLFIQADVSTDPLPGTDLILCRDCLVHLSFSDVFASIRNFKRGAAAYLLTTTFVDSPQNVDIPTGDWRQLNLQRPPFNFPAPVRLVDERCTHSGGIFADKRLGLWEVPSIPW